MRNIPNIYVPASIFRGVLWLFIISSVRLIIYWKKNGIRKSTFTRIG